MEVARRTASMLATGFPVSALDETMEELR